MRTHRLIQSVYQQRAIHLQVGTKGWIQNFDIKRLVLDEFLTTITSDDIPYNGIPTIQEPFLLKWCLQAFISQKLRQQFS